MNEPTLSAPVSIEVSQQVYAELKRRADDAGAGLGIGELLARIYDPERREVDSIEALAGIARQPRVRLFEINGKKLKLNVRPLSSDESADLDRIPSAVLPPKDLKTGLANEDDPIYKQALLNARRVRQAMAIELCIPKLKIPGNTAQEKGTWLSKNMVPGVIDELWASIYEITANPVEHALFTSASDSDAPQG